MLASVVAFGRELRSRGLRVTPADVAEALRALLYVDVGAREEVRAALRACLVHRREDLAVFDDVFDAFWQAPPADEDAGGAGEQGAGVATGEAVAVADAPDGSAAEGREADAQSLATYSPAESLIRRDFGSLSPEEEDRLAEVCAALARRLAIRLGRRLRVARRGRRIDLRASLRRSFRTGGDVLRLAYRRRRPRRTRLVVLCDVSGSMEAYSRFLLRFVRALQRTLPRVEAFTFSTSLQRVTGLLRRPDAGAALRAFFAQAGDWAGGTRIGACLRAFRQGYGSLLDRHSVLIICSDGLDTGDTDLLAAEMAALRRRCRAVLWLNPLAADPAYQPLSLGMQAALPAVDVLAPAGSLANLLELERHIEAVLPAGPRFGAALARR
jgi:uncharacterized protein with von Willebrand factor type A (vWA) domain